MPRFLAAVFVTVLALPSLAAPPVVFKGARIHTAAGQTFDPGTLVIQDGRIVAVGPADRVAVPKDAEVRDVSGRVIIPGLVDSHSHLGVYSRPGVKSNSDGNEGTGPVQTLVRALDSLNPFDPGIRMANAGGVTTANVMPGSANVIGGQTIYVKLRGYTPEQMWIASADVLGGLKMANGENPKRSYGSRSKAPGTRMKVAALQRAELLKARDYLGKLKRHEQKLAEWKAQKDVGKAKASDEPAPPETDLGLQTLAEVLERKRTVHFHSHRADDILTVLRLKQEFGFELVLQHGTEAYKIVDEIAKAGVPVSMTILDSPGGKAEVVDFIEQSGAELAKAGIKVLVNTDDPVTESRFLLRTAATAVRGGLSEDLALAALTRHPAEALHLQARVGSLEAGKDADFAILSGPPFSVYSRVLQTWIDGRKVFDLEDPNERLYQTGGFAVAERQLIPKATPILPAPKAASLPSVPAEAPKLAGESREFVVYAGRLHTVSRGDIEDGAVHVKNGQIVFAGLRKDLKLPAAVPVLVAKHVTPGLIDAHTSVPLSGEYNIPADQDADEESDPNQAEVRVLDGFNPAEPLLRYLLENGITVVHGCPGRANVIAGQTGVFRTHGRTAEEMTIRFPQAVLINLGEVPKETYKEQRPGTRMGTAALIRGALTEAANYRRKQAASKDPVDRNLKLEVLASTLDRSVPAMFCAQRADDLLTAIRITDEFHLDSVLALAAEGYLVREQLAKSKLPVIVHPTMQRAGSSMETYHSFLGNAAALSDAKVLTAIGTSFEGYVPKTRVVRHEAAVAMVHGLGFDRALRSITLDAAKVLRIDDRFGSLDAGKSADLVLYDGDPFEYVTHVTHVVSAGRLVHTRSAQPLPPMAARLFWNSTEIPCCLGW